MADAKAIGAGTAEVTAYFRAAAQKIVDDGQLTGAAFTALVKQFPALKGAVVEFGQAVDTAAAKAEAAARRPGYQDRAFAAGTDPLGVHALLGVAEDTDGREGLRRAVLVLNDRKLGASVHREAFSVVTMRVPARAAPVVATRLAMRCTDQRLAPIDPRETACQPHF